MKSFLLIILLFATLTPSLFAEQRYVFKNHTYSVKQSGINYHFTFNNNISDPELKNQAGIHIIETLYNDTSLEPGTAKTYKKERAQCYAIESRFYTYTLCFLPHEFTQRKPVLQGFITRVPNGIWLLTNVLLPVSLIFVGIFYLFRHNPKMDAP
jgi:hypothetical protein